jgi:hypothetical protein
VGCLQRLHREFRIAKVLYVNCYNCSFIVDFLTGLDPRSGFSFKRFFLLVFHFVTKFLCCMFTALSLLL